MTSSRTPTLPTIGWREWVALPELGVKRIKAKIDTGARTSALHAFALERFERDGAPWVRFEIHPKQRAQTPSIDCEAPILEERKVRSSSGHRSLRPVIRTTLSILGEQHPIEITLASRDAMGFRMLLGREALRGRFQIDPGRSYVGGRPPRKKTRKKT